MIYNLMSHLMVKDFDSCVEQQIRANTEECMRLAGHNPDDHVFPTKKKATKKPTKKKTKKPTKKKRKLETKPPAQKKSKTKPKKSERAKSKRKVKVMEYTEGDWSLSSESESESETDPEWKSKESESESLSDSKSYGAMLEAVTDGDPVLKLMLEQYKQLCAPEGRVTRYHHALNGMYHRKKLSEVWIAHQGNASDTSNIHPPMRISSSDNKLEYSAPGKYFTPMATDAMQVLEIFLKATEHRGIQPIRWDWDFLLLKEMKLLDSDNVDLKNLACLVCLILSAATTDQACIDCTVKLKEKELLSVEALLEADTKQIAQLISAAGIQHRRAKFLKQVAQSLKDHHGGKVPANLAELMKLSGVGRKSAILLRNELFGFWSGIGTDLHVFEVCVALGFIGQPREENQTRKNLNVDDAEASLREWVQQSKHRDTNKIFGSFAQLMTQEFDTVRTVEEKQQCLRLVRAIGDYIYKPYHVELLWWMIKYCRVHYKSLSKKKKKKLSGVKKRVGSSLPLP